MPNTPNESILGRFKAMVNESTEINLATASTPGIVKPDGQTITIDNNGIISSTGSGSTAIKLSDVSGLTATSSGGIVTLTWSDPENVEISGVSLATWTGTKIVRKIGSAPANINDGTLVVNSTTKNQYSSTGFVDNQTSYDTNYYYRAFPYTDNNLTTNGSSINIIPRRIGISNTPTQSGTITYDGTVKTASWNNFNTNQLNISGNTGTNAGTYTATFTPKEGYMWADDNSMTAREVQWQISPIIISTVPTQSGTITYDGTLKTASWNNFNTNQLNISGNTGTNAGNYTATFTPKANYAWSDSTTTGKTASWSIAKAAGYITTNLGSSTITLDSDHNSVSFTITGSSGGITITNSNSELVTHSVSGNTVSVSCPSESNGNATITITSAATSNYNSTTVTVSVVCDFLIAKEWMSGDPNTGTDNQIKAMIQAADAGNTDILDIWAIGDSRTVQLASFTGNVVSTHVEQTVELVLMHKGLYQTTDNKTVNFVIGFKNMLAKYEQMNSSDTTMGSWSGSSMRTLCNGNLYNALPQWLRDIMKTVKVTTGHYNGNFTATGGNNVVTKDKVFLAAEKEVQGYNVFSTDKEAGALTQFTYYTTAANKIKKVGASDTVSTWWLRSPRYSGTSGFCAVSESAMFVSNEATYRHNGLAPCMCI